jgi:hypothetical protein
LIGGFDPNPGHHDSCDASTGRTRAYNAFHDIGRISELAHVAEEMIAVG